LLQPTRKCSSEANGLQVALFEAIDSCPKARFIDRAFSVTKLASPMTPADYIDRHPGDLIGRLQRLVGFATVNPPGDHYDGITAWLTRELQALGVAARRHNVPVRLLRQTLPEAQWGHPRYNVLGKVRAPGARRTLHFNAHYDVVPVSGEWRHGGAFSGAVEGGWIYGRGTADMKGSIASLLMAVQALRATRTPPRLNWRFHLRLTRRPIPSWAPVGW
jgi:succinyl-diaminopimelate desuccinylase